jgi:outer membrane protein TolC
MSSSSPLVAVGISAIVLLGTAAAAPAQSSQANADATNQKSSDVDQASSRRSRHLLATSARSPQEPAQIAATTTLAETLAEVHWTNAATSEENQSDKLNQSIATPSIKIFVGASQPEAATSRVAQVTSEDELDESDEGSDEPGAGDTTPEADPAGTGEETPPTLPRVDPSNMINPPGQPTSPEPDVSPDAPDGDAPDDLPADLEPESPIAPVTPADPVDAPVDAADPVDAPDSSTEELEEPEEVEEPTPLPDAEPFPETPTLETPAAPAPTQLDESVDEGLEDLETDESQEEESEEIEAIEDDELIQPSDPVRSAPDYLDPDANPLSFPTTPEEVELVGTQPLTLEQAIELGIRNSADLQAVRLELDRARATLREQEAANYPTVTVGGEQSGLSYQANEQAANTAQATLENPNPDPEIETPVSRTLGLGVDLTVSYSLYTSGRRSAAIQAAERRVRLQELQIESETEDLILQITRDYYDLQEADEEVQIFRASLEEAERSLRDAEALERAGVGTRFDVLQAQVDVANALQNLRNQESDQEIARRQLAERLNLNQTVTLAAADPIEVAGVWELGLEETIVAAYRNRAELEQQLVQREVGERERRGALAELGPQVTVQTSYGLSNTLASNADDDPRLDAGFLSNFSAALGFSIPIFEGGAARARARQAEANIAIAETNFANQRDQIRFQVEQAYSQLNSNFENIQTTALAVQQAIEALRLARLRFQAGVGTQTDVLQAQTALTQARFNNLQAILNYNRALATLRRQVSNFPGGELNEAP